VGDWALLARGDAKAGDQGRDRDGKKWDRLAHLRDLSQFAGMRNCLPRMPKTLGIDADYCLC